MLGTISGMDENHIGEVQNMCTAALTYAVALSTPRFAPIQTESAVSLDGLATWHANILVVEDIWW